MKLKKNAKTQRRKGAKFFEAFFPPSFLSFATLRLCAFALIPLLAAGCASNPPTAISVDPPKTPRKMTATALPPAEAPKPRLLPLNGRIAGVNDQARFVVVDFSNSPRPTLGQKLHVYRVGQKVAEVKVSGPFRETTVAADITAGEAKYGDEVKAE